MQTQQPPIDGVLTAQAMGRDPLVAASLAARAAGEPWGKTRHK